MGAEETRFEFGDNWRRFLGGLNESQVDEAMRGLRRSLGGAQLAGRTFLDIGSGSGIHSLAAHRLGAARIVSFDYDADSVACTEELRLRAGSRDSWTVMRGSILGADFLEKEVPPADVVYSWGVLHHTGATWDAIRNAAGRCAGRDALFMIGTYNRKSPATDIMKVVKRAYASSGPVSRAAIKWGYWAVTSAAQLARGRNPLAGIAQRRSIRGMDYWRDLEDWVGGYPYECATPEEILSFVRPLGFDVVRTETRNTIAAVNEYLFRKC